ncbi:MAG: hypothetical protein PVG13_03560 [Thiohalophilus sp.]|jgi:hypothetical protein
MSRYSLVSIDKSPAPQGQSGDNWYRYVISNEISTIVGYRCGTLGEARAVARECVMHLNSTLAKVPAGNFARRTNPVADVDPILAT